MKAMLCIESDIRSAIYTICMWVLSMLGEFYNNFTPMVLIHVETNWPGS